MSDGGDEFNLDRDERERARNKKLNKEVDKNNLKKHSITQSFSLRNNNKALLLQKRRLVVDNTIEIPKETV
jgi:hypothetical protein